MAVGNGEVDEEDGWPQIQSQMSKGQRQPVRSPRRKEAMMAGMLLPPQ